MNQYFAILRVKPGAEFSEVKKAYRKAVLRYHPDSNGGVGNTEMFKQAVKAYQVLQKHYKSIDVKKVKENSSIFSIFAQKESRQTQAKRPRKRKVYSGVYIDPVINDLSFEELRMRFAESSNRHVIRQAALGLALNFGASVLPIFDSELKSRSPRAMVDIIFCLGLIDSAESVKILESFVRHKSLKVACAAVNALQNIQGSKAKRLLKKIEREGKFFGLLVSRFLDNRNIMKMASLGLIERSEIHIANALKRHTRQPLPVVMKELGWVIPAAAV